MHNYFARAHAIRAPPIQIKLNYHHDSIVLIEKKLQNCWIKLCNNSKSFYKCLHIEEIDTTMCNILLEIQYAVILRANSSLIYIAFRLFMHEKKQTLFVTLQSPDYYKRNILTHSV